MDSKFKVGDKVLLDNKVPCTVDGYYRDSIVVLPEWKFGKAVWGTWHDVEETGIGEVVKISSFSIMLVHPSNLTAVEDE